MMQRKSTRMAMRKNANRFIKLTSSQAQLGKSQIHLCIYPPHTLISTTTLSLFHCDDFHFLCWFFFSQRNLYNFLWRHAIGEGLKVELHHSYGGQDHNRFGNGACRLRFHYPLRESLALRFVNHSRHTSKVQFL